MKIKNSTSITSKSAVSKMVQSNQTIDVSSFASNQVSAVYAHGRNRANNSSFRPPLNVKKLSQEESEVATLSAKSIALTRLNG